MRPSLRLAGIDGSMMILIPIAIPIAIAIPVLVLVSSPGCVPDLEDSQPI
jgi:hypothetical protein